MSIACEIPVDAGRAGRRLLAIARAVPALGLMSCAVLMAKAPPSWAEAWLPDSLRLLAQTLLAMLGLACLLWALQALFAGQKSLQKIGTRGEQWTPSARRVKAPRLTLDQEGIAHLEGQALCLDSVCALPGLLVAVFAPISRSGPKLSGWNRIERVWSRTGKQRVILIGQDAVSPEEWRRLHVWMLWVQRAPG